MALGRVAGGDSAAAATGSGRAVSTVLADDPAVARLARGAAGCRVQGALTLAETNGPGFVMDSPLVEGVQLPSAQERERPWASRARPRSHSSLRCRRAFRPHRRGRPGASTRRGRERGGPGGDHRRAHEVRGVRVGPPAGGAVPARRRAAPAPPYAGLPNITCGALACATLPAHRLGGPTLLVSDTPPTSTSDPTHRARRHSASRRRP
jgi:hypothetical protein